MTVRLQEALAEGIETKEQLKSMEAKVHQLTEAFWVASAGGRLFSWGDAAEYHQRLGTLDLGKLFWMATLGMLRQPAELGRRSARDTPGCVHGHRAACRLAVEETLRGHRGLGPAAHGLPRSGAFGVRQNYGRPRGRRRRSAQTPSGHTHFDCGFSSGRCGTWPHGSGEAHATRRTRLRGMQRLARGSDAGHPSGGRRCKGQWKSFARKSQRHLGRRFLCRALGGGGAICDFIVGALPPLVQLGQRGALQLNGGTGRKRGRGTGTASGYGVPRRPKSPPKLCRRLCHARRLSGVVGDGHPALGDTWVEGAYRDIT